ncbi:MAG: ABC transporter ATP-binding protein [Nanoarchaeota archaeon]|nr:ABC transporter ATP-binding protein [Nanoarchaeota archaeon]
MSILSIKDITKNFKTEDKTIQILKGISFDVKKGEFVAIIGSSGSGKSTLLSIIAGLDNPSSGKVILDKEDVFSLNENQLSELRNKKIGFIFQSFFLVPSLNAYENIELPSQIAGREQSKKINSLLKTVGMEHRKNNYPIQLSGGEKQRIAIARALINDPEILFADEPTGNLDSKNSKQIIELLQELHKKEKKTIIVVTHEPEIAKVAQRVIEVKDGKIISDKKINK